MHNDQYDIDDYGLTSTPRSPWTPSASSRTPSGPSATAGRSTSTAGHRRRLRQQRRLAGSTAKAVVLAQTTGADPRRSAASTWWPGWRRPGQTRARPWAASRTPDPKQAAPSTSRTSSARRSRHRRWRRRTAAEADEATASCSPSSARRATSGWTSPQGRPPDQTCDGGDPATSRPDTRRDRARRPRARADGSATSHGRRRTSADARWLERSRRQTAASAAARRPTPATPTAPAWPAGPSARPGACGGRRRRPRWVRRPAGRG